MICYIGLGGNLGDLLKTLHSALDDLNRHPAITVIKVSSFYGSKPHGPQDQPDYLNAVAEIETSLEPHPLLDVLQQIENNHKRIRTKRWGPRTLDLDLLLYGDNEISTERLIVPHPRIAERSFVLYPLTEINSGLKFPDGQLLSNYLAIVSGDDLWKLEDTMTERRRVTVNTLRKMKQNKEKIVCLTAYDASFARVVDQNGADIILVGDSLGMVIQGHDTTIPVTVDDIIYHTRAVSAGAETSLLIADLPFMSYTSPQHALQNARRLMQEGRAHMVKLEGGAPQVETVRQLTHHGVPVCAHLGLTPQSVHKLGGYRVQGRDKHAATQMLEDAHALEQAGADAVVLECVPTLLAKEISFNLKIPTIGIGAGPDCDGQVLVLQDLLGITPNAPKFSKDFMTGKSSIAEAIRAYNKDVKSGKFPAQEHCFV